MKQYFKTLWAATKKNLLTRSRYRVDFIMAFFWPLFYPLTNYFISKGLAGPANEGISSFQALTGHVDYASFMIIGSLIWMFINFLLWSGGAALYYDRITGTFETQWITPAPKSAMVLGNTLSVIILTIFPLMAGTFIFNITGMIHIHNFLNLAISVVILLPFLIGFLLTLSAITMRVREVSIIIQILRTVLAILCGMQFPLAVLPGYMQTIGKYIPITQSLNIMRGISIYNRPLSFYSSEIAYVLGTGFVLLFLSLLLFRSLDLSIKKNGLASSY